ncbi:MAG: aminoglycoside phosphotransferase family protein [Deltaproteobacteria bacterium]|nr:aminoglycoside phosphotransferase family protein [Deltaproteobacteria bacterium]MBM4323855.1 aminoglycoside phosphotransferase family protein [Deltaproteobacteria bacterium]
MVLKKDLIRFAREALGLSETIPIEISSLEGRGSDRSFYRLIWNRNQLAIMVHYDPKRIENNYYADIAVFLRGIDVPAPRLIRHDPARYLIVMEDLGETDLWSLRNAPWEIRRTLYQKTLSIIHKLHCFPEKDFPSARVKLMESFGPDLYRWEQDYFRDHFVRNVCGVELEPSFEKELEADLSALAERLKETERCLIHRDLQSQNVMIHDGEPFLIDFQGMRFGSLFYDLGSLLCDPYVDFNNDQRLHLLQYYYKLSKQDLDWDDFQMMFWTASAQRLMQALGAYGFWGLNKGLKAFLDHIPAGVRNLHLAASQTTSFPILKELTMECQRGIEQKR